MFGARSIKPPVVAADAALWGLNVGRGRCGALPKLCEWARYAIAAEAGRVAQIVLGQRKEAIGLATRRRGRERAETREEFEFERVVSCSSGGWGRYTH
jgi:hypothetical protein